MSGMGLSMSTGQDTTGTRFSRVDCADLAGEVDDGEYQRPD
jgi:hypothetical protein